MPHNVIFKYVEFFSSISGFKIVDEMILPQIFDDWNIAKKIPKKRLIIASEVAVEKFE